MADPRSGLRCAFESILRCRGLQWPTGRPLYEYRFTRTEFDSLAESLKQVGRSFLDDRYGAALFVAFTAEWYRRERGGGSWDWIQPLGALGVRYHPTAPHAMVKYPQVRVAAETGLRVWKRQLPKHGAVLLAVIREAGFPAAALREGPRLAAWLKHSVLDIEMGFSASNAVRAQSWRAGETLVQALYEPAVALCQCVVELRARLPNTGTHGPDAVEKLDALDPGWRSSLPFDLEERDVRLLVEDLVRAKRGDAGGLVTVRRMRRTGDVWTPMAELLISGSVGHQRLPGGVRSSLEDVERVRIRPVLPSIDFGRAIVAMERLRDTDDDGWELRPLVQGFETPLPLGEELRLAAMGGEATLTEFTAFAGEPLRGPVVALEPTANADPSDANEFEVLGTSPVSSTRPWLALAIASAEIPRVRFENPPTDLGQSADIDRRIFAFTGKAELDVDGLVFVWRTAAQTERCYKLVFVGETIRQAREQVYRGRPQAWLLEGDLATSVQARDLRWRSIGSRDWHSAVGQEPVGAVEFAVQRQDQLVAWARADVVPPDLSLAADPENRQLRVTGLKSAMVGAAGEGALPVTTEGSTSVVDLRTLRPGATVHLSLRWANTVDITLPDPVAQPMLLDPSDRQVSHARLSMGRLSGFRLLSPDLRRLCFELKRAGHPPLYTMRNVEGLTPLSIFSNLLREMVGGSPDLDAKIRLVWIGRGDWVAEIGLYDIDRPLILPESTGPFDVLGPTLHMHLKAFSLSSPAAGVADPVPLARAGELRTHLQERLGDGPWILLGTSEDGHRFRPKILDDETPASVNDTPLAKAIGERNWHDRLSSLDACLCRPDDLTQEDRRQLVDLCVAARSADAPYSSIDALKRLSNFPQTVPWVLASCDSLADREAVLRLQDELPLLWCMTPIDAWMAAFGQKRDIVAGKLSELDLPTTDATAMVANALGQIVDLWPALRVHAHATLLFVSHGADLDESLITRLGRSTDKPLWELAADLVRRRADLADPPSLTDLPRLLTNTEPIWLRFDETFAGVIAAPVVAAGIAEGKLGAPPWVFDACRTAWLYDREYFEGALTRALKDGSFDRRGAAG